MVRIRAEAVRRRLAPLASPALSGGGNAAAGCVAGSKIPPCFGMVSEVS